MTLEQLLGSLTDAGVATLDTGHRISAGEARRLAARHRLVPMVLGGPSEVLDLGHEARFFKKYQRLALGVIPVVEQPAFCTDSSLLPRTPDAAEAWLRFCPARDGRNVRLPKTPDAAGVWLAR